MKLEKKENNISDLSLKITTMEIQLMSIRNSIEDIVKAIQPKAKIDDYFKWSDECEKVAKQLLECKPLENKKESESD